MKKMVSLIFFFELPEGLLPPLFPQDRHKPHLPFSMFFHSTHTELLLCSARGFGTRTFHETRHFLKKEAVLTSVQKKAQIRRESIKKASWLKKFIFLINDYKPYFEYKVNSYLTTPYQLYKFIRMEKVLSAPDHNRQEKLKAFDRLLTIMDELRENCPWDKKQTIETLRHLTIEETYELSDAILEGDLSEIKKEIGDIMLHLVFYARIASEKKAFDIADVLNSLCEKLIERHPHIPNI